ncbi:MAG: M16 family metallopeptidase [Alphaproteobacteria bacterium]
MKKLLTTAALLTAALFSPTAGAQTGASGIIIKKPAPTQADAAPKKKTNLPEVTPVPFRVPKVQRVVSPKGIEAWLIEEKSTPVIALSATFKGGAASDPERLTGLSELAMSLLDEGAGRMNAEEFQGQLAEKAVSLSFDSGADTLSAHLRTLRPHRRDAFGFLRLALTSPRFDRKAVRRVKEQMYALIEARRSRPANMVYERWLKLVFKGHPYSRLLPTREGVKAVGRGNLRRFVRDRFARDNLFIGVAGNISAEELAVLLDETFGDLPEKSNVRPVPPFEPQTSARIDVLSADIPQSAVIFGHRGLPRSDPDFYAAYLLNYIFGGGSFSARIFKEAREKKGLVYSIGTYLSLLDASPMLVGSASSDNAKMAQTVDIVKDQWAAIADSGPTAEELRDAKTYMTGSFPLAFTSSAGLASFLAFMQYENLGIDYLEKRNALMEAVTPEQIRKTARRLFLPDSLFFVVVGKPANL